MTFKTGAQVPHPIDTLVERPWELALAPFQVAPRTYYVSGQRWVGAYLVDAGAELVLVDAGPAEGLYLLLDAIWQLGFDPRCIGKIFVSHAHFDHCGAVAQLRALTGAEVWMSAEDAAFLRACPAETFGVDSRLAVFPFEPDRLYASGEPLRVGEVVFTPLLTPGHTPGCTSLFWQVTRPARPLHRRRRGRETPLHSRRHYAAEPSQPDRDSRPSGLVYTRVTALSRPHGLAGVSRLYRRPRPSGARLVGVRARAFLPSKDVARRSAQIRSRNSGFLPSRDVVRGIVPLCLGLGEKRPLEAEKPAVSAQRPALGEIGLRNIPPWERRMLLPVR